VGLNLHPHALESRLTRAISLPTGAATRIERVRPMNFPQAVFWFKAAFVSDQKEEEILRIGIDLHYLREVRHLDSLLAADRLSEDSETRLPEAHHAGVRSGYRSAQRQVAPTVASLANARRREWTGRVEKQIGRMSDYYAQLRREADEQMARGADPLAVAARAAARLQAIDREEQLRCAELRQKSMIRVRVQLARVMMVQQPKLAIFAAVSEKAGPVRQFEAVWDPLSDAIEAIACPACGQPTFALRVHRHGIACPNCGLANAVTIKAQRPFTA
jgi:hypothetical protein